MLSPNSTKPNFQTDEGVESVLKQAGFMMVSKLSSTIQGGIWRGKLKNGESAIIKATDRYLHRHRMAKQGNQIYSKINENVVTEQNIMKFLSEQPNFPDSIIRFKSFFKSNHSLYLSMSDGGSSLFDWTVKVHKLMTRGLIQMSHFKDIIRHIFKQMVDAVHFCHKHGICHFDVSLENFVINDIQIDEMKVNDDIIIRFHIDQIRVRLIDFGLAHKFKNNSFITNKHCGKPNYMSPECHDKGKMFDAASNDIFCLGVCLWMLSIGNGPWKISNDTDQLFWYVMKGQTKNILNQWNKLHFVDSDWLDLIQNIFKNEDDRITISDLSNHEYLK